MGKGIKLSQSELDARLRANPQMTINRRLSGVDSSLNSLTTTTDDRAMQANANRISGENFQKRLDDYHYWHYELTGRAWVYRTAPEAHFGMGGAVFARKGAVDYIAYLPHAATVHFDAKVCSSHVYHIDTGEVHQLSHLKKAHLFGQIAGYLIWWSFRSIACWHPVQQIDDAKVPFTTGHPLDDLDWLTAVQNITLQS